MDLARIRELLRIVAESDVDEVELEEEGVKLVVRKNAPTLMVQPAPFVASYGVGYPPPAYPPAAPAAAPPLVAEAQATPSTTLAEPEEQAPAPNGVQVRAPIVGTYYEAPAPDADPFVHVGASVQPGDVLCIIEAMKLMNEIESEMAGTVRQILARNAEPVEYDQPLFVIEPA